VDKSKVFWTVFKYFKNGSFANPAHEEADTRMILHAIHADKTFGESGIKGRIIV
jgi:hypothetical protein